MHLRWKVPERSTEDSPLAGKHGAGRMSAGLCRATGNGPCVPLPVRSVTAGDEVSADDPLPPELRVGPEVVLRYRVTLRNAAGRSTGTAPEAVTIAGAAPAPVEDLTAESRADGVHLHWTRAAAPAEIVLERRRIGPAAQAEQAEGQESQQTSGVGDPTLSGAAGRGEALQRLSVKTDRGGAVDALAPIGGMYEYTVGRVRSVRPVGPEVQVHGTTAKVTVDRRSDAFPPAAPAGLVAVEVAAGNAGNGGGSGGAEVSLSWEPNAEADLLGYLVYRAEAGSDAPAAQLTVQPLTALSYDDASAQPGHVYRYSVAAVNTSGRQSARSAEVSSR